MQLVPSLFCLLVVGSPCHEVFAHAAGLWRVRVWRRPGALLLADARLRQFFGLGLLGWRWRSLLVYWVYWVYCNRNRGEMLWYVAASCFVSGVGWFWTISNDRAWATWGCCRYPNVGVAPGLAAWYSMYNGVEVISTEWAFMCTLFDAWVTN